MTSDDGFIAVDVIFRRYRLSKTGKFLFGILCKVFSF